MKLEPKVPEKNFKPASGGFSFQYPEASLTIPLFASSRVEVFPSLRTCMALKPLNKSALSFTSSINAPEGIRGGVAGLGWCLEMRVCGKHWHLFLIESKGLVFVIWATMCRILGIRCVQVESDNLMTAAMVRGEHRVNALCHSLVDGIRLESTKFHMVEFHHTHREGNFVADFLSHHAYSFLRRVHILDSPPEGVGI